MFFLKTYLKKKKKQAPAFLGSPQAKGHIMRLRICTPRKPNSARRPVAKTILFKRVGKFKRKRVTAHVSGSSHNLKRHSTALIRGGGARDLPGVNYSCVRGVYDFLGISKKTKRRSIYGAKRPVALRKRLRRKFRFS